MSYSPVYALLLLSMFPSASSVYDSFLYCPVGGTPFGSLFHSRGIFLSLVVAGIVAVVVHFFNVWRSTVRASSRSVGGCVCRCGCLECTGQ